MQEQMKLGIIQGDPELVSSTKTCTKNSEVCLSLHYYKKSFISASR